MLTAGPIVFVYAIVYRLLIQFALWLKSRSSQPSQAAANEISGKIAALRARAAALNSPETFVEYAKATRELVKLEKENQPSPTSPAKTNDINLIIILWIPFISSMWQSCIDLSTIGYDFVLGPVAVCGLAELFFRRVRSELGL